MKVQLKALLSSGRKSSLLSGAVIRELNTLVNTWEMNKRIEKANPM
jgi:hypothetical protein